MRTLSMIASILLLISIGKQDRTALATLSVPAEPTLSAASAVLYESSSGTFVLTKDADTRRPMASTTKIVTALVATRLIDSLDEIVTVSSDAVGIEGSSLYLREGEQLSIRELLYGLLLQSANDAATAIAIHCSGSTSAFADEMNKVAGELGLSDTHFSNPHGLHADDHYTTARELAILASVAMEDDLIREIASTVRHTIPKTNLSPARPILNHNKLLRLNDCAIGLKTGFTKASGRCLVGAFEKDGLSLITITLSAPNDWEDHKKLFAYATATLESRLIAQKGSLHYDIPIIGAKGASIRCTNAEDVIMTLPREAKNPEPSVSLPHFLVAPIRKGAIVGTLSYRYDSGMVFDIPLIADETVEQIKG